MTHLPCIARFTLLFVAIAAAACGDPSDDPGTPPDGGTIADPDDDHGPVWGGQLPSPPRKLEGATSATVTDDDRIVYTTATGVQVVPVTGGAPVTVSTTTGLVVRPAGPVALLVPDAVGPAFAWSQVAGLRPIANVSLGLADVFRVATTASGGAVLVTALAANDADDRSWIIDTATLTATEVQAPSAGRFAGCEADGEVFVCMNLRDAETKTDVWTVSGTTVSRRAILDAPVVPYVRAYVVDDALVARSTDRVFSVPLAGSASPRELGRGSIGRLIVLQSGHVVFSQGTEVRSMRADGSEASVLAASGRLSIERDHWQDATDWRRVQWAPVCESAGAVETLVAIAPATATRVELAAGCRLGSFTYSDRYAFVIDNWTRTGTDGINDGTGDPIVVELATGTKRSQVVSGAYFRHDAAPLRNSKLFISELSFADLRKASLYDGHTSATTPGHALTGEAQTFSHVTLARSGSGVILYAAPAPGNVFIHWVAF